MTIERLYTRPHAGSPSIDHPAVVVHAGEGIEGDRYRGARDEPGQNVTFIEAEEIEAFAASQGQPVDLARAGRNVVTRGVRLNALVGREFLVGGLRFRGVELCEPCLGMGQAMATPQCAPAQVVRHWVARGGLRTDALSSGTLAVGAVFDLDPAPVPSAR